MRDSELGLDVATENTQITKKKKKKPRKCFALKTEVQEATTRNGPWKDGTTLTTSREDGDPGTDTRGAENHQEQLKACLHQHQHHKEYSKSEIYYLT